jgi:hypothetical protein
MTFNAGQTAVLKSFWVADMDPRCEPPVRLDPKAKDAHEVVKLAAMKGFSVRYHDELSGYIFRHRLGKVRFWVPDLHLVDPRDLEVWD